MQKKADLHVHTYYSDGTFSPGDVVKGAERAGLAGIAVCDHDCTDAIEVCQEAAKGNGVEIIPGVEMTAEMGDTEVHILGYFIDKDAGPLVDLLKNLKESRIKRIYKMIDKLKEHNLNISPEAVFSLSTRGTTGRLHLAAALYNNKLVSSMKQAFTKYLGDGAPCYVARFNVSPSEAIDVILKSGGVPVYAHPKVMGRDDFIPGFLKAGLRGLEAYHADHNKNASQHYLNIAQKYGLVVTGGSDSHGSYKGQIGSTTVPYSIVEDLRRESESIRKANSK